MNKRFTILFFLIVFVCSLFLRTSLAQVAEVAEVAEVAQIAELDQDIALAEESISISNAWIREAPPTAKVLAGYLEINNHSDQPITLLRVESPCFNRVMLHRTELIDGIATMRHSGEIVIPAHSRFSFSPGAHHLMLMGKKMPMLAGDDVELTLIFSQSDNLSDNNADRKQKSFKLIAKVRKHSP